MNNICHYRHLRNMTQSDLACKSNISREHLCQLENGKYSPNSITLLKLAKVLDCSMEDLINTNKDVPGKGGGGEGERV